MRLVIHAGFGKCGSSSIQHALQNRRGALKRQSIFLFGNHLRLDDGWWSSSTPFWMAGNTLVDKQMHGQVLGLVSREIDRVARRKPHCTAVISSEVLGNPGGGRMFRTIDARFDTTVVFYIRPQFQWIPSAWKQWGLSKGISLDKFTDQCLASGAPLFRKSLEAWRQHLPQAKTIVRVLPDTSAAGGPARDFLAILGARLDPREDADMRMNPSPDFAMLQALNRNPWLFAGRTGNEVFRALAETLPERFPNTDAKLLSFEQEQRIAEHFHRENLDILQAYVGLSEHAAADLYTKYYRPRPSMRAVGEILDVETDYRSVGVHLDALIREHARKRRAILRRPYWKIPWRTAKHFIGA